MFPRCLSIPEIQLLLCEELGRDRANRESLVDLSLTNKQFQEVALNELWRTQTSLFPLFKCFPSDSWIVPTVMISPPPETVESEEVVEVESLAFTRCILQKDWDRVSFYARRIYILDACWEELDALSRDFWQILSASLPTDMDCLLPELRELRYPNTDTAFHTFNLFISSHLHNLTLSLRRSALRLTTFRSLPELCPSLKTLVIHDYTPGGFHVLKPAIVKFTALQNLTMGSITADTLDRILSMTTLETLDVRFTIIGERKPQDNPIRQSKLRRLRKATFRNIQMYMVPQVITPLNPTSLTEIKIHAIRGKNEENWAETFAALPQFANSLESVEIIECPPTPIHTDTILTQKTFEDILAFSKLKRLRILTKSQVSLSNDFIQRLGESCRGLRLLEIEGNSMIPDITPTLNGLLPFLEHCQDLNQLSLYIDASQNPYHDRNPPNRQAAINKSLTTLHVGYSPISDTVPVATFLATVTPSLREIQCLSRPGEPDHGPLWQQTALHLQVARNLRTE